MIRDTHSDLVPCCLHRSKGLLMSATDHIMVIRDLGQHLSSGQADQHLNHFINYNAEHAGTQGGAQFRCVHLKVTYCDRSVTIVHCPTSVFCLLCIIRHQQFALKAYFSYTPRPTDSKLGRKHLSDLWIKSSSNHSDQNFKMATMAAILKMYFAFLHLNRKAS